MVTRPTILIKLVLGQSWDDLLQIIVTALRLAAQGRLPLLLPLVTRKSGRSNSRIESSVLDTFEVGRHRCIWTKQLKNVIGTRMATYCQ